MITFQMHAVTNGQTKVRVHYSHTTLIDGRKCVTLYAKDYGHELAEIFAEGYENATDISTDYFEKGHVRIFPDNPLWQAALNRAQANEAAASARYEKRLAKWRARQAA